MLVTIHQPHYLPWLGYLHRMAQADLFILLDHVQFERGNYQNRTRIRVNNGVNSAPHWLTVPVEQHSQKERIADKRVENRLDWARAHFETLRRSYGSAGYFGAYAADLRAVYSTQWERLADLNDALLEILRRAFDIRTPLLKSSTLGVGGQKSELVLNLCRAVGAKALLVGLGGSRAYLDRAAFAEAGIELRFQEFTHPQYVQRAHGAKATPFTPGLSAVDLLFNRGAASRDVLFDVKSEVRLAA
jgi:hypothetical protein